MLWLSPTNESQRYASPLRGFLGKIRNRSGIGAARLFSFQPVAAKATLPASTTVMNVKSIFAVASCEPLRGSQRTALLFCQLSKRTSPFGSV